MPFPNPDEVQSAFTVHGGNLAEARRAFPDAAEPWIDLSTGISPWPYPADAVSSNACARLPEPEHLKQLEAAARAAYRAQRVRYVVPCPGSDLAIGLLPRFAPRARDVAIVSPTYGMHERSWRAAGFLVRSVAEPGEIAEGEIGVIVNPNNPDGRLWDRQRIAEAAHRCARGGGLLVVDEAFGDVAPAHSMLDGHDLPAGMVVLRSFGKFYGLAGLRLGFILTGEDIGSAVSDALGSWSVSGQSIAVGIQALNDHVWRTAAIARLDEAGRRLGTLLQEAGLEIEGGTPLFQLVGTPDLPALFRHLASRGILTRPLPQLGSLRFGIPGDESAWDRLRSALAQR